MEQLRQVARAASARAATTDLGSLNEANTKALFIEPMLTALGWNVLDLDAVTHHSFAGVLSPDEVIAMWADDRADLLRNQDIVTEEVRAAGVDKANRPMLESLQSIALAIQTLDRAIEYAESNSLGTCSACKGVHIGQACVHHPRRRRQ